MMGALAKYYNNNELIEQFFLYFPHSGRIITRSAMYEPDFFFNNIVRYEEMSENNWNKILSSGPYRSEYLRGDITISDSKTIPTITYMTSLPAENYRFNRAILCVILNVEKIKNRLKGMAPGGALYVMNKNGETLCAVGATDAYNIDEASAYATSEGVSRLSIHSEKTTVLNKTSDSSGWRYLFVIPDAVLARSAYALTAFLWQMIALCLLIGLICAIRMTYVNFKPINRLKKLAVEFSPAETEDHGKNELNIIQDSLEETHRKNVQLSMQQRDMMEKYEKLSRFNIGNRQILLDGLITRMMRGQIEDWDAARAWLSTAEITCDKPFFCVASAHIDARGSFSSWEGKPDEELAIFTVKSILQECSCTLGYCYVASTGKDTLLLFSNMEDQCGDKLHAAIAEAQRILMDAFEILISVGLGNVVHCIENVQNSYAQAIHTLAYRFVKGKGALISYKDTEACDKDPIKLPSQFTEELTDAIRQKNKKKVQAVLDKTYDEWFNNRQLSMFQAQSLYFFIINIAMSALDEINIDLAAMAGEGLGPLDALTACETIGEVFKALADILTTACEYSSTISKRDHLVKAALSYIAQNFSRMDFSQTLVADALNVTPTYLSRVVKAVTGRNMIDILNEIRIEKAKELLMNQDCSLSFIAETVGIGSVKSLIRVFKQHTGMTPGRMRESAVPDATPVPYEKDE